MTTTSAAIRNPRISLNLVQRDQIVSIEDQRVLIVGQKLAAGSAATGLVVDIPRTNAEINALFGARSHLALMCRAFRKVNPWTKLDVIALADAVGTSASSKIVLAGDATEDKTIYVDVVSSRNHSYKIDVETADDEAAVNAKLLALVNADANAPFTAALSTTTGTDDTITFTASNKGTLANGWLLRVRDAFNRPASVAGLTLTLTGWASGATDPTLTSILDPADNIRYQTIVWPSTYATTVAKSWINARFNLDNDIKDGVVVQWVHDSFANVKSAALAMNSPSWVMLTNEPMSASHWKGAYLPEAPDVLASIFAGIRSRRFEEGISISDLVVINEGRDQFGGRHIAALPYFNTPFVDVEQPFLGSGYTYPEQLELEAAGVSVVGSNIRNNSVIASVMVTTYTNDAAGNEDDTWHYLNWRDTHSVIREFFVNNLREDFAQHRLTTGSAIPNMAIADEATIRAALLGYYNILSDDAITVRGREQRQYFEDKLDVVLKPSLRRVEMYADVPMVSQFGEAIGTIKFHFDA